MAEVDDWISLREFSRRCHVNVNAVQQALANGRIVRRADKKIHWPTQSLAWDQFRDESKIRDEHIGDDYDNGDDESAPNGRSEFQDAKTRRETAVAGLKEIELEIALGELVRKSHVEKAMAEFAIDVREKIMAIPERVASELASEVARAGKALDLDAARILVERLWRRESRLALERISREGGQC